MLSLFKVVLINVLRDSCVPYLSIRHMVQHADESGEATLPFVQEMH